MPFLNLLERNGSLLALPLFVLSAALLAFCLVALVRQGGRTHLFTLPLVEQQPVQFTTAGSVVLALEGPRLSTRFAELSFELCSPEGRGIPFKTSWLHARTSGLAKIRMELGSFSVADPGQYTLRLLNFGAARPGDAAHAVVLSRSQFPRTLVLVLGIVLSAGLLIGSVILLMLRGFAQSGNP